MKVERAIKTQRAWRSWLGVLVCASLAQGCGADDESDKPVLQSQSPCLIDAGHQRPSEGDGGSPGDASFAGADAGRRDPGGSYFAAITANGTGCPAGTWDTRFSPDGRDFKVVFSAFEAEVDQEQAVAIKNCQIAIKLVSPQGMSFAVRRISHKGFVFLEDGVHARIASNFYFQGDPLMGERRETAVVGPYEDSFEIEEARVDLKEAVWSPCGVERDLNVNTTIRLLNTKEPRRSGSMRIDEAFGFEVDWRRCSQ